MIYDRVSVTNLRNKMCSTINRVKLTKMRIVIFRNNEPIAAIVLIEDLGTLDKLDG